MPQVPTNDIAKNVEFKAAYTSSTFNDKNFGFYRFDGVLEGMDIVPAGAGLLKATVGAFIQQGIIVELLQEFSFPEPAFPEPWVIYATTDDEVSSSPTTIDVVPAGSEPAGVVILATRENGVTTSPKKISIKEICAKIQTLENERKIRRNFLCNAGFELINLHKGVAFAFPGPAMDCWNADNLTDKAVGSGLSVITDPLQTIRGGASVLLTSEAYLDPGGVQPDTTVLPARVRSNARIFQTIQGYKDLIGEEVTFACSLRLPIGHGEQLHDLEIAIYGSSIGTPGFSDTPVDKFSFVIPAHTLSQDFQQFFVQGTIVNLNAGLAAAPTPAFPGISVRVAFIDSEPDTVPTGAIDKVLIDDCILYQGTVDLPQFFPIPAAVDWLRAEYVYEAQEFGVRQFGQSTDVDYRLGQAETFRSRKAFPPSISIESPVVIEDGAAVTVNSEAIYNKVFGALDEESYEVSVQKTIAGFRPSQVTTTVRAQA